MANLNPHKPHSLQKLTKKTTFPAKPTNKNADHSVDEAEEEASAVADTAETDAVAEVTVDVTDEAAADSETADTKIEIEA
jgi:hypothetical protein